MGTMKTRLCIVRIEAQHARMSMPGHLCQNTDGSMSVRFCDSQARILQRLRWHHTSIRHLLLYSVRTGGRCGCNVMEIGNFDMSVWFDSRIALPVCEGGLTWIRTVSGQNFSTKYLASLPTGQITELIQIWDARFCRWQSIIPCLLLYLKEGQGKYFGSAMFSGQVKGQRTSCWARTISTK